ncbi:hypothetical protein PGB90_003997 [Kerria lacca]
MNVGAAVRFFLINTAAALELTVKLKNLLETDLTTAFFIRLMHDWFELMSSRSKAWTSLNKSLILASLTICNIADWMLQKDG